MNRNRHTTAAHGEPSLPSGMPRPAAAFPSTPDEIADLLRPLARRAVGMSGADVERLVREARVRARRERRQIAWDDLAALLDAARPPMTADLRWRVAIHEAGHAVVRLALARGRISMITIDDPSGGYVKAREEVIEAETEPWVMSRIAICLAGRAAELEFLGNTAAGAGGSAESDLGRATDLALSMETELGFSTRLPLVYRKASNGSFSLIHHQGLAEVVNARLEEADRVASDLVKRHRTAVEMLAHELMTHLTLEGEQLTTTLGRVAAVIANPVKPGDELPGVSALHDDAEGSVPDRDGDTCSSAMTEPHDPDFQDADAGDRAGAP